MSHEPVRTFDQLPSDSFARPTVLIVDDDPQWRDLARDLLNVKLGNLAVTVLDCDSVPHALEILNSRLVHAVILDRHLGTDSDNPNHDGAASIPKLLGAQPHLQILMATSHSGDRAHVVEAMRNGACGYVIKHEDMELFIEEVRKAIRDGLREFHSRTEETRNAPPIGIELKGSSPAIQMLKLRVEEMAKVEASVLLLGESGTGKSVVARLLHNLRSRYLKRAERPFVRLNMGAISATLAEGELFGSDPGSFTDGKNLKIGALEQANGGTLFLDEIGDASLDLQVKLLTALERGVFRRIGGTRDIQSHFRLICATNRNLDLMVSEGKFREDLYRRISVIEIKVPSLKERKEDIGEIVKSVLPYCCERSSVRVDFDEIPKDFIAALAEHPPIGNIGGVENQLIRLLTHAPRDKKDRPILKQWRSIGGLVIKAGVVKSGPHALTMDEVLAVDFDVVDDPKFPGVRPFLAMLEKKLYEDARRKKGNEYGAARLIARALQVSDQATHIRLKFFGLTVKREKPQLSQTTGKITESA